MIKLIIFDVDGVLVDTESIHRESLLDAVKYITHLPESKFSHLINIDGKTTKHKLELLKNHLNLTDLQVSLIDDKKQQNVIRHFYRPLVSSPDQYGMFEGLKDDYKLAVASNSRKENVLRILNVLGITHYFPTILSNDDVEKHKPDPEIFLTVMKMEEVEPNETLILEDSEAGKYAAITSGAHVLPVGALSEVTLENIQNEIRKINTNNRSPNGGTGN